MNIVSVVLFEYGMLCICEVCNTVVSEKWVGKDMENAAMN
jgi:hypothetical protein